MLSYVIVGYVWQILGTGGIFAPRSVSRPKKTQPEYDEQKKHLSGNFKWYCLLSFADIPRKQLNNEIKSEEKKSDLSYLLYRCVQRNIKQIIQNILFQAGKASAEPKRQELKISKTYIYLNSINGRSSVASKKVFWFSTGGRACVFKNSIVNWG